MAKKIYLDGENIKFVDGVQTTARTLDSIVKGDNNTHTPLAHKTSHQAGGSDVVDADTVDTKHASDLVPIAHITANPIDHPDESITFAKTKGIERFIDLTATYTQIINETSMSGYKDCDVSAYVSAKATRILVLSMHSADTSGEHFTFGEKNNSRAVYDYITQVANIQDGEQAMIPLDANKKFRYSSWGIIDWDVWLLGYWEEN